VTARGPITGYFPDFTEALRGDFNYRATIPAYGTPFSIPRVTLPPSLVDWPEGHILSVSDASALLAAIKLGPFPFAQQTFWASLEDGLGPSGLLYVMQKLDATMPDRDDPSRSISLTFSARETVIPETLERSVLLRLVRDFLRRVVRHEMDEQILVAGIRVFDPHTDGSTRI
jgi:hypothetical protein